MPADLALAGPFEDIVGGQFRTIVADDRRRLPCPAMMASSSRAKRRPEIEVLTASAKLSRGAR